MCTCVFNYLLGQLGMGTTITRNETKRFVSRHFKNYGSVSFIELASKQSHVFGLK
jgi:hypothetical protein